MALRRREAVLVCIAVRFLQALDAGVDAVADGPAWIRACFSLTALPTGFETLVLLVSVLGTFDAGFVTRGPKVCILSPARAVRSVRIEDGAESARRRLRRAVHVLLARSRLR